MGDQVSKIFEPTLGTKYIYGLIFLLFQIFLIYIVSINTYTYVLNNFVGFLFLGCVDLVTLFAFLSICTEQIEINSNVLVRTNLFRKLTIQISKIQYAKLHSGQKGTSWLMIKTNDLRFSMGGALGKRQINDAIAYILEQICINYPENYEDVKTEHYEVDKFWGK
jgi:hypothetical protein